MPAPAKPNDILHRYVLRPGAARKVKYRVTELVHDGTRTPLGDIRALLPSPASVVLDVGANIGYVAADFKRAWPACRLCCFEPTPLTFGRLQENLAPLTDVECFNVAISDREGVAPFRVDNKTHGGGSNSLLDHSAEFALSARVDRYEVVEVPTMTLDAFCEQQGIGHVDLLKLDIEGAEPLALHGAAGLLERSAVDVIMSEARMVPGYEGGPLMHELIEQLAHVGYRPFGVYHFARSAIGQATFGDIVFLGPAFRHRLIDLHGASACGFID